MLRAAGRAGLTGAAIVFAAGRWGATDDLAEGRSGATVAENPAMSTSASTTRAAQTAASM
jgi:hypothetical protein